MRYQIIVTVQTSDDATQRNAFAVVEAAIDRLINARNDTTLFKHHVETIHVATPDGTQATEF